MPHPSQTFNSASPIRLVVFDLGRVLIRICNNWPEACRRAGVPCLTDAFNHTLDTTLHDLTRQHDIGEIHLETLANTAGPLFGMTAEQFRLASCAYLYSAYPGVAELIDEVNATGLSTACLSNTNSHHWQMMNDPSDAAYLPLDRLTYRFASQLIGKRKPDPAIYAYVERETGMNPDQILFFDDLMENVEAARGRGWHTYWIDPAAPNPISLIRSELSRQGVIQLPTASE